MDPVHVEEHDDCEQWRPDEGQPEATLRSVDEARVFRRPEDHEQRRTDDEAERDRDRAPRRWIEPVERRAEQEVGQRGGAEPGPSAVRGTNDVRVARPPEADDERDGDEREQTRVAPSRRARTVREERQSPEERALELHRHGDRPQHDRHEPLPWRALVTPGQAGPQVTERGSDDEVLDHRRTTPDDRERREQERDERGNGGDRISHASDQTPETERRDDERDECSETHRGIGVDSHVHRERCERLEQGELVRQRVWLAKDRHLRLKEIDPALVEDPRLESCLRLAEGVDLEQRLRQCWDTNGDGDRDARDHHEQLTSSGHPRR